MQLAPSLHRIGSDIVGSYLVEDDSGVTIIDAGLPRHWDELVAELAAVDRSLEDVRGVVLTHGDTDHIGYAERLRRDHGVPIHVHEADAQLARGESKKKASWGRIRLGPLLQFLWYAARRGGLKVDPITEVTTFVDGQTMDLPGEPRVVHLPGHTPGSVAVYVPAVQAVFVGDAFTTRHVLTGAEGPGPAPFTLDREEALKSLARLEDLETDWILPGHGPPWRGDIGEAIEQVRQAATR